MRPPEYSSVQMSCFIQRQLPRSLTSRPISGIDQLDTQQSFLRLFSGEIAVLYSPVEFIKKGIKPASVTGVTPIRVNQAFFDMPARRAARVASMTPVESLDLKIIILHRDRAFFASKQVNYFPNSGSPGEMHLSYTGWKRQ